MIDRESWRRHGTDTLKRLRVFHGHLDRFCARMNDGLAAIAVVLALVVVATAVVRVPELLAQRLDQHVGDQEAILTMPE
jgi:hypothetical protein